MKYKGLLLDYDGTTVVRAELGEAENLVSRRVNQAMKRVTGKARIGFCTGRKFFDLDEVINQLNLEGPHIVCGGAQLIKRGNEVVWEKLIDEKLAKQVYRQFTDKGKMIHIKQGKYHYIDSRFFGEAEKLWGKRFLLKRAEDLDNWKVPQMVLVDVSDKEVEELERMGLAAGKSRGSGGKWICDVMAHGVTKQEGILQWLKYTGLKREEVVGVGDGYNDVPMLNAVGLKIAMGNAVEEVKAMADLVAPSVDEDGVATVIEKFFI